MKLEDLQESMRVIGERGRKLEMEKSRCILKGFFILRQQWVVIGKEGKLKEAVSYCFLLKVDYILRWSRVRRKGVESQRQCWGKWVVGRVSRRWLLVKRSRECSFIDVGVVGDLTKDVRFSSRGFSYFFQLFRIQSFSCYFYDFYCKFMVSSSMNITADYRVYFFVRVRKYMSQGFLFFYFYVEWSFRIFIFIVLGLFG